MQNTGLCSITNTVPRTALCKLPETLPSTRVCAVLLRVPRSANCEHASTTRMPSLRISNTGSIAAMRKGGKSRHS